MRVEKELQDKVLPGHQIRYRIRIWNNGQTWARNVVLTDTLPADCAFAWSWWGGEVQDGRVIWRLGDLNPGWYGDFEMGVDVGRGIPGGTVVTNTVEITNDLGDADPADNRFALTSTVESPYHIRVQETHNWVDGQVLPNAHVQVRPGHRPRRHGGGEHRRHTYHRHPGDPHRGRGGRRGRPDRRARLQRHLPGRPAGRGVGAGGTPAGRRPDRRQRQLQPELRAVRREERPPSCPVVRPARRPPGGHRAQRAFCARLSHRRSCQRRHLAEYSGERESAEPGRPAQGHGPGGQRRQRRLGHRRLHRHTAGGD
ncbi:MAG: hypothetical protein CVU38_16605 [Chloroflexi bacterium HGW-Chloroflexi-1]|nr:MAG: hypothetical protein CVU38_16605 [Chloroflexi bacterium HGW-Chloroflexi-1]